MAEGGSLSAARTYLEHLRRGGVRALPRRAPSASPGGEEGLEALRRDLGDCRRCGLHRKRRSIVLGQGPAPAELMLIGEGPGAQEDLQGVPFVGPAGQLLTRMLTRMGLDREEVYITNVVKCRPPRNRDPEPEEIRACRPFLERQVQAVRPRVIVALGRFAAQTLLGTTEGIMRLRGRWGAFGEIPLMPTYHPSYLLRYPRERIPVWEDMLQVLQRLGRPLP